MRLRRLAARRLRALYGATKPLPKPPGKYQREWTEEEQLRDFEAAKRRADARDGGRSWRAGIAANRAIFKR